MKRFGLLAFLLIAPTLVFSAPAGAESLGKSHDATTASKKGVKATTSTASSASDSSTTGPHPALVPTEKKNNKVFHQRHEAFLKRGKEGPIGVLFLGDSITQAWEKSPEIWEQYFGAMQPANFGIGGDRTQHVLWRIEQGELDGIDPKVVVLMIGTNNANNDEPEPIIQGVTKITQNIHKKLPEAKILLLAVFPRNHKRDMPENIPMKRVEKINEGISKLDNGDTIRFLNINERFLQGGETVSPEIMPDGVHLTAEGYKIWAEAITPLLKEMYSQQ